MYWGWSSGMFFASCALAFENLGWLGCLSWRRLRRAWGDFLVVLEDVLFVFKSLSSFKSSSHTFDCTSEFTSLLCYFFCLDEISLARLSDTLILCVGCLGCWPLLVCCRRLTNLFLLWNPWRRLFLKELLPKMLGLSYRITLWLSLRFWFMRTTFWRSPLCTMIECMWIRPFSPYFPAHLIVVASMEIRSLVFVLGFVEVFTFTKDFLWGSV